MTTTYRIEIHENNNHSSSNTDEDCDCRKEMAHRAKRIYRQMKQINQSDENCSSSFEHSRFKIAQNLANQSSMNYSLNPKSINTTSSNSTKCKSDINDSISKNNRNLSMNIEYKFVDIIVGSILTMLIWYFLSNQTGNFLFLIVTSTLSLFLITLSKYKKHIGDQRFWQCFISNLDSLFQAYCTMLTICIITCMVNNHISKISNSFVKWSLIGSILLILINYIKPLFSPNCSKNKNKILF